MRQHNDLEDVVINIITTIIMIAVTLFIIAILGMSLYGIWEFVRAI
ncbi:hypothetical protein [Staphylococcus capitis]|nr:hypothetical protein [Staphylococcus capitis]MEB5628447.1 hypothetical protein [Staphylococcus capitis]